MIEFHITIREEPGKGVHVHVSTPPGKATIAEMKCGVEFQDLVNNWNAKHTEVQEKFSEANRKTLNSLLRDN